MLSKPMFRTFAYLLVLSGLVILFGTTRSAALNDRHSHSVSGDTLVTSFSTSSGSFFHEAVAPTIGQTSSSILNAGGNPVSLIHPANGQCLSVPVALSSANYSLKSYASITSGTGTALVRSSEVVKLCPNNPGE